MYKTTNDGIPTPTANLAINRSRIKLYGKNSEVPTYYLQKGQEFQIELFNPTKDTIMAKISLNGKPIAQGGLVLKPAQRVFLDRYIDVARKFKFDTYEVANTSETRKAIEDNGDFKVEFYKERTLNNYNNPIFLGSRGFGNIDNAPYFGGTVNSYNTTTLGLGNVNTTLATNLTGNINTSANNTTLTTNTDGIVRSSANTKIGNDFDGATLDWLEQEKANDTKSSPDRGILRGRCFAKKKSIETGRVEAGSRSDQTLETVYMNWEYTPFHSIECKMLPISQKVNTVEDMQVKRYCTNCGGKNKTNFKFCPICGTQV